MWGDVAYRVWLPTKDAVIRVRSQDLGSLDAAEPTVNQILHTAAAAKLFDALEDNLLLAPMQSSVVPLPHQLHALNRAIFLVTQLRLRDPGDEAPLHEASARTADSRSGASSRG